MRSEREKFEEWFKKRHMKTGLYEKCLCGDDDSLYLKHEMYKSWQAAKDDAVPDGFLLMPRKCTNKMAHAAKAVDGRLSAFKYSDVYDAMVEVAQETTQ